MHLLYKAYTEQYKTGYVDCTLQNESVTYRHAAAYCQGTRGELNQVGFQVEDMPSSGGFIKWSFK